MNILLIMADEMRADCMGCSGNDVIRTPHLDKLAAQGFRSTAHTCSTPQCTPSRASILTGLTALQHGAVSVGRTLDRRFPTLADVLSKNGYRCGLFGKSHLEAEKSGFADELPQDIPYYGFGEHALCEDAPHGPYWKWLREQHPQYIEEARKQLNEDYTTGYNSPDEVGEPTAILPVDMPEELSQNDWITAQTEQFIEARDDEPFFAVCSFVDPHHPWSPVGRWATIYNPDDIPLPPRLESDPPEELRGRYSTVPEFTDDGMRRMIAAYYGMISHIDDCVGRLLAKLQALGLEEDTIVLFTSDHGDFNGDRLLVRKGAFLTQNLLGVPFVGRVPGCSEGVVSDGLSQHEDLMPTLLNLCGVEAPANLPGIDLQPALHGGPTGRTHSVFQFPRDCWGIADEQWLWAQDIRGASLHDWRADPSGMDNREDDPALASRRNELRSKLLDWMTQTSHYQPAKEFNW